MTLPNPFETFEPITEPPRPGLDAQLENAAQDGRHGALVSVNDQRIDSALRFCLHRAREIARVSLACFCFRWCDILHNARQSA